MFRLVFNHKLPISGCHENAARTLRPLLIALDHLLLREPLTKGDTLASSRLLLLCRQFAGVRVVEQLRVVHDNVLLVDVVVGLIGCVRAAVLGEAALVAFGCFQNGAEKGVRLRRGRYVLTLVISYSIPSTMFDLKMLSVWKRGYAKQMDGHSYLGLNYVRRNCLKRFSVNW